MRLVPKDFKFYFEFRENEHNLLIVEQPTVFCQFVHDLFQDVQEESRFVLSEDNRQIKLKDNLICTVNPWAVSLNERRLLNGLYEYLYKEIVSSELMISHSQVLAAIEDHALHLLRVSEFDLTYSEQIDIRNLLKFLNIKFLEHQDTLIERLVDYIQAMNEILKIRCYVFVNLLSYLTDYELEKLLEYACYQKVNILLLESRQPEDINKFSNVVIIDKDCCEILLTKDRNEGYI